MVLLQTLPYFLVTLAFSLTGQVLLKMGVTRVLAGQKPTLAQFVSAHLFAVLFSPYVLGGIVLCGLGVICWMYVLSSFEIGRALPILGGMAYITLFFAGRIFLKEQTNWLNFAGILLIIAGLFLVSLKAA
jgi:multidrug transporter EmrE-like cation transporter